jgi:anti-anti-sigma regulatory factor
MRLEIDTIDGKVVALKCFGELTQDSLIREQSPIRALLGDGAYGNRVIIDLSEVPQAYSAGLGWMVASHRRFQSAGGRLVFHSMTPRLEAELNFLHLNAVLFLAKDAATARELAVKEES